MVQYFTGILPYEPGSRVALVAGAGALVGLVLWLAGSRFSRSIVTLLSVAGGAFAGLQLPRQMELPVGGWATAVGGALVLGLIGYALHRLWIGSLLALLLGGWALIVSFILHGETLPIPLPGRPAGEPMPVYLMHLWTAFSPNVQRVLPLACGLAMVAGLALAVLWERLTAFVFYSLLGTSLIAGMGVLSLEIARPQLLRLIPGTTTAQLITLAGMTLFGIVVQWRMAPGNAATPERKNLEQED
jgi:hypothetical protein